MSLKPRQEVPGRRMPLMLQLFQLLFGLIITLITGGRDHAWETCWSQYHQSKASLSQYNQSLNRSVPVYPLRMGFIAFISREARRLIKTNND